MRNVLVSLLLIALCQWLIQGCGVLEITPDWNDSFPDTGQSPIDLSPHITYPGLQSITETSGPGGIPIQPPRDVVMTPNSTSDWFVSSDQGGNLRRMNYQGLIGTDDWEFRFEDTTNGGGSEYYSWNSDSKFPDRCPFEVWNMGLENDTTDDIRIQFAVLDDDTSRGWSYGDRIYISERRYYEPLPEIMEYTFPDDFHIGRIRFNDYSGTTAHPADGTVVLFYTFKPDYQADSFRLRDAGE